uniref:Uncharacterized protein n=1 Tax=Arion vulgaris TaxID=1028688 RepID=A0A0B6ZH62_9EUPU
MGGATIYRIAFILVLGHTSVDGNERVERQTDSDILSDEGREEPMHRSDILNALIEYSHKEDFHLN